MTPAEHNARRWLKAVYLEREHIRDRAQPGWYVVRTCPCHQGQRVTECLPSAANAFSAIAALLRVSEERGELAEMTGRRPTLRLASPQLTDAGT